jgi:hypothetical protein
MTARSKMLGNGTIRRQKPLRVPRGLELLHALCALAGGLVGILGAIIEVPVLAMLHPRQQLVLRCAIAFQLIGDEHPWNVSAPYG